MDARAELSPFFLGAIVSMVVEVEAASVSQPCFFLGGQTYSVLEKTLLLTCICIYIHVRVGTDVVFSF